MNYKCIFQKINYAGGFMNCKCKKNYAGGSVNCKYIFQQIKLCKWVSELQVYISANKLCRWVMNCKCK